MSTEESSDMDYYAILRLAKNDSDYYDGKFQASADKFIFSSEYLNLQVFSVKISLISVL